MSETERIKKVYEWRKTVNPVSSKKDIIYSKNISCEREIIFKKILENKFKSLPNLKIMEIGAGTGNNIYFFKKLGIPDKNIFANELLDDRIINLQNNHPLINIFPGNALDLIFNNEFDIVFQSTVFTSILDLDFRKQLAEKMWTMTKPGGIILWYDFVFCNPFQSYIKPVTKSEVKALFQQDKEIKFHKATLFSPIGKRVNGLYNFINSVFPFLRAHIIAIITKPI